MVEQGESGLLGALIDDLERSGMRFDPNLVHRFVASLMTKRFVILTGVTGSGKTRLAQAYAYWLSGEASLLDSGETVPNLPKQRSDGWLHAGQDAPGDQAIYRVDAVDSLAIQFSNERKGQRVKVTLPNGLIDEWVETIQRFGFSRNAPARDIREQVAKITGYSTQLNSFETHLKAAAFAILEQRRHESHREERPDLEGGPQPLSVEEGVSAPVGSRVQVVAVGADWNSSESVLGYPDALQPERYVRTPTLDLILRANESPGLPHFLILDEMNLSHVERYFSDILSSMESGEPIHLFSATGSAEDGIRDGVPPSIALPDNLFIIGTVNVDETTYLFSPKVLDRANTIEFRVSADAIEAFLEDPATVDLAALYGSGGRFASSFLAAARDTRSRSSGEVQARVNAEIGLFFTTMADHGAEFGFRTALEMSRFIGHYRTLSAHDGQLESAIDAQIYQKVLPRLSGSRARLEPVLRSLLVLCRHQRQWELDQDGFPTLANRAVILASANTASESPQSLISEVGEAPGATSADSPIYPLSEAKILRMLRLLGQNGFTSFAEA